MRSHPKVQDVAVIGVPHNRLGEVPRAFIVKKVQDLGEEELQKFVGKEVADYKNLRGGIEFVQQIPKSPAGKILRKDLRAQYSGQA